MTIKEVSKKCGVSADTIRYYESAGVIPAVKRNKGGIRDFSEEDINWVLNAKCMRKAGLPVGVVAEYVRLFREGDKTIDGRLELLKAQRVNLLSEKEQIEETLDLLNYKIEAYEKAVETGKLVWEKDKYKFKND